MTIRTGTGDFDSFDPLTRRSFMTAAAAGAVALPMIMAPGGAAAHSLVADRDYKRPEPGSGDRVKLGIIGVGGRGTTLLRSILKTGLAEVVEICDIDHEARAQAISLCEGMSPKGVHNYTDLLDSDNIEAVVIATPVDLHHMMAIDAIMADKHIYCEKPLGLNATQADEVYEAARMHEQTHKKVFQVGFQWVYNANFRAAVEAVHSGMIGGVRFVNANRYGGDLPRGKQWLFQRDRSGDIIVEQAVHEMNIFCWGLRLTPDKATGFGGTNMFINEPIGRTIMDHYSLSYEFPGPVRVNYSHLYYAASPFAGMNIHFFGTQGMIDVMQGKVYMADGSKPEPMEMKLGGDDTQNGLADFLDRVRDGGEVGANAEKGWLATKMAVLGRTAIYQGGTAHWDEIV